MEYESDEASLSEAALTCYNKGGRLAELSSKAEATKLAAALSADSPDKVWLGSQLVYRHPNVGCGITYNASQCDADSRTQYRWISSSRSYASAAGKGTPALDENTIFGTYSNSLQTGYPIPKGVAYQTTSGALTAESLAIKLPFACSYTPADSADYLRSKYSIAAGAAAGFGLSGCVPSDDPGLCLNATLNVIALSIALELQDIYFTLFRNGSSTPFARRGNTNVSMPWALKLFEGAISVTVQFWLFSAEWLIAVFDGFTAAEGKLFDFNFPVNETFRVTDSN